MGELTGIRIDNILRVADVADIEVYNVFTLVLEHDIKRCVVLGRRVRLGFYPFIEV